MKWLEVNRSTHLKGCINVPGSKNSSLGLLAAACLASSPVTLHNIPDILDIHIVCDILKMNGAKIVWYKNTLTIDASNLRSTEINPSLSATFRTAYYFIGSLLAKYKKVSLGYPGGDRIGPRPIDQHFKGFQALGARFSFNETYYIVEAEKLTGADIYFDVITSGATINLLLAAVLAKGKTTLYNAAKDPEIVDIAILLNKMGAKVFGAGTDTIRIEGVDELYGCTHSAIPDRLIAGAFLMAAGITDGEVTVKDIVPEHLGACLEKLTEIGLNIEKTDNSITAYCDAPLKATRIKAGMYPALGSDFQQPITALLLKAKGRSVVTDRIFPKRFNHCIELRKMGADISFKNGNAYIAGNCSLVGAQVHANDIRAGTCLILAGLVAEGTTSITGVEHIERGFDDVVSALTSLGADIRLRQGILSENKIKEELVLNRITCEL